MPAPDHGKILTEGVVITAEDGSFELVSGEVFETPFACNTAGMGMHSASADMASFAQTALEYMDARRVRVTVPSLDEPLYGVLVLSHIYRGSSGPATRSFQIQVPEQYVQAALGGRVSVVYERYKTSMEGNTFEPKSWVLWISDMPF